MLGAEKNIKNAVFFYPPTWNSQGQLQLEYCSETIWYLSVHLLMLLVFYNHIHIYVSGNYTILQNRLLKFAFL